jgi:hypothetical protein
MEDELKVSEARKRIEEKMNELKIFDHRTLLIYAAAQSIELQDRGLNLNLADGFDLNNFAAKMLIKGADLGKTYQAIKNAEKRHAETYDLKKQAIDYWHSNIDHKLSNQKAADLLIKVVPVSHRKLAEYVAEAKRLILHPAS